jgi:(2Fe-2S) ferredoxin
VTSESEDPAFFYGTHVFCCTNERAADDPRGCCHARGGTGLRNYMKLKAKKMDLRGIRINAAGCLDRCALGPTMVIYPEGVWYSCKTREDVDEVLQVHLVEGGRVERLMLHRDDT